MSRVRVFPLESRIWRRSKRRTRLRILRARCKSLGEVVEGVFYGSRLAGRAGMSFLLLPEEGQTVDDVERAAAALLRNRDVVSPKAAWLEAERC